jgi:hypothetical protein
MNTVLIKFYMCTVTKPTFDLEVYGLTHVKYRYSKSEKMVSWTEFIPCFELSQVNILNAICTANATRVFIVN